jgi:hypothetical protein
VSSPFLAKPPKAIEAKSLPEHLKLFGKRFGFLVWQIAVPFKFEPEPIDPFPELNPPDKVAEATVKQCQWIFDQSEQRRNQLEQKAQATFNLMLFLVPLLASTFVFVVGKTSLGYLRTLTIALVCGAALFVLLGFISAIRAVGVKTSQTLSLTSVLNDEGRFRSYSEDFQAKGLLYCASMNTAMNDHLAQFVRGAHSMTATAVFLLILAALPTGLAARRQSAEPTSTRIVGPIEIAPNAVGPMVTGPCGDTAKVAARIDALEDQVASMKAKGKSPEKRGTTPRGPSGVRRH